MAANWGCIEEREDDGTFIAYHIMPMITMDGDSVVSDAHDMSKDCHCRPFLTYGRGGWKIYDHHDPDHPGSREKESKAKEKGLTKIH